MSSETLSQNEIDALLGGSRGAVSVGSGPRRDSRRDVQVYDFRRPHRVSKERLRTLEAMYERLVKGLEAWLIGRVREQVECRLQSVEQYSFGEFILSLPTPCASYILDIRNTGGQQGVMDFGHELAYFLVDRLFGGGASPVLMQRALTPIERLAVRGVSEKVMQLLTEIWQDHVPLDLVQSGFESSPDILQAARREDPVLVANIEVTAGAVSSLLLICLPFAVLDRFFSGASQRQVNTMTGSDDEIAATRRRTERSLRQTRAEVAARLPEFRLSLRDIAALSAGGVLMTGIPRDAPITVRISGQPRWNAAPGRVGRRLAVRLTEYIVPDTDDLPITDADA